MKDHKRSTDGQINGGSKFPDQAIGLGSVFSGYFSFRSAKLKVFSEDFCLWCQRFRKKSFCQSLGKTMSMIFKVLLLIFQNLTFFPQNLRSSTSFKGCSSAMAQNENFSYFKELTSFSSKLICNYETCPIFFSISG